MRKLILLLLLSSLIYFLPNILSGTWAKSHLITQLEKRLGGQISVEHIQLSWTQHQKCQNIQWIEPEHNISLSANTLTISDHLFNCLRYREKPLALSVEGATLTCEPKGKLLKRKKKYKHLEMKCSPIQAILQHKKITFETIDIDVTNTLKIKTWGNIDLHTHQMDITLGLPSKALHKLFGIKDLPEDYLLEVPLSCKLSSKALEKQLFSFFLENYSQIAPIHR